MRLRFRQTTPSDAPDVPFQPGQIIAVAALTETMRAWLVDGQAELLPDAPEEAAVIVAPERAVQKRAKGHTA